ncbi:hypothetical protein PR048_029351 [Dryococelus australis]|uniref:Uncharacterized protein n=1 Tax=Dryococelus australis TaxID=614101 RepID=A0ABQ9GD45_9NEOP|nr:hypothetical protein PR048_029351 [Dryococelus australis]
MSTVDELVAYATIACALQKRREHMDKRMVPRKESLHTRQLAYGTGVLPRRLNKLPAHGRPNSPGTFKHGYSSRNKQDTCVRKAITPN